VHAVRLQGGVDLFQDSNNKRGIGKLSGLKPRGELAPSQTHGSCRTHLLDLLLTQAFSSLDVGNLKRWAILGHLPETLAEVEADSKLNSVYLVTVVSASIDHLSVLHADTTRVGVSSTACTPIPAADETQGRLKDNSAGDPGVGQTIM